MNPFDLHGPEFLVFYAALSVMFVLLFKLWRWTVDQGGRPSELPHDPYLLAYLRGGRVEALRTALFMFFAEGAAQRDGRLIEAAPGHPKRPHHPFEEEVWAALDGGTIDSLQHRGTGQAAAASLRLWLDDRGLTRSAADMEQDRTIARLLTFILVAVAITKIIIAVSRGRTNILILVLLMIVVAIVGLRARPSPVTKKGERALQGVQGMLEGSRMRMDQSVTLMSAEELTMIAAGFGLGVFAPTAVPYLSALGFSPLGRVSGPDAIFGDSSGGMSSCSTASSCGSSCGGGCGGGGGGGGCGGCGS
jgi:uncharacterized protein (TIGR04222 family)